MSAAASSSNVSTILSGQNARRYLTAPRRTSSANCGTRPGRFAAAASACSSSTAAAGGPPCVLLRRGVRGA
eukprot:31792-Chlamydomonas_euryale.AAC.2